MPPRMSRPCRSTPPGLLPAVSVTLNQDDLRAMTSVMISPAFEKDRLWLNGE